MARVTKGGGSTPAPMPGAPGSAEHRRLTGRVAGFVQDLGSICEKHAGLLDQFPALNAALYATVHMCGRLIGFNFLQDIDEEVNGRDGGHKLN